ncbi:MAG: helix-turn-helix domain-containing protein [Acidobacteria bacterium]|nr:helix-turn-helix domain-containing protein [Acidobacteriota bacterium]MBM3787232.1 helix-turn-helix domain-containing protein [Acidobacteriota bacterium]
MARDGELPVIRCGKRLLIPRAAFQKWLETCGTSCPSTRSALEDPKRAEMMRR